MNRKKWALLSALLLATVAPLPTLTPPQLIPAVSAKQHIESGPSRDTDGDPEEYTSGKPDQLKPPKADNSVGVSLAGKMRLILSQMLFLLLRAGRV